MKLFLHNHAKSVRSVLAAILILLLFLGFALDIPDGVSIQVSAVAYENDGDTTFVQGDQIRVENIKCDTKNQATYTYNGTSWQLTDGALVWNGGTGANNQFHAWYPTASYDAFVVPADQSDADKLALADWMTASTDAISKPENKELALNFQHRNAKVTVQIVADTTEFAGENPEFSNVKIYTCDTAPVEITPFLSNVSSYTAIVTPGVYTAQFMTVTVDGVARTVHPAGMLTADSGLAAGKHYHFTLTVGKERIELTSVNVSDWDHMNIDGGVAEEVNPGNDNSQQADVYSVGTADALLAAIASAQTSGTAQNPATIKLTANIDLPGMASDPAYPNNIDCGVLIETGVMTIDLNGYTLSNSTASYTLLIDDIDADSCDAVVTITDTSVGQTGEISGTGFNCIFNSYGTLIISGGTFAIEGTGNVSCINNYGGSLTINDGRISASTTSATGKPNAILSQGDSAVLAIHGGEFSSGYYCVNVASGTCSITDGTFTSEVYALYIQNAVTSALVTGGSFTGASRDITAGSAITGILGFDENGNGATFPDGVSCDRYKTLQSLIADGAGFYDENGNLITISDSDTSIDGTVTVKSISTGG